MEKGKEISRDIDYKNLIENFKKEHLAEKRSKKGQKAEMGMQ